jgi:hypothetical protein
MGLRARWHPHHDNDDQKFLVLPNGDEVPFSEYGLHYAFQTLSHDALLAQPDYPTPELWHARLTHFGVARIHLTL